MGKDKDKAKKVYQDSEGRTITLTLRSKFRCATSGKYNCDECGKAIDRGDVIRFVDVKYTGKMRERFVFCSKEHRNDYCDAHGIPQDKFFKQLGRH